MDYENKHKEEITRATQLWECGYITRENLEYIFPELKENVDEWIEKIRKDIISYLNNRQITSIAESSATEIWIACLEKQEDEPTLRERYENIGKSKWFKKTHEGMSVSDDEESNRINEDERIRKMIINHLTQESR